MIDTIVANIRLNAVLPFKVYEGTLHTYYEGIWRTSLTPEGERLDVVKPLVEKSLGEIPKAHTIDAVHTELKTDYFRLDNYADAKEVYINHKNSVLMISEDGIITLTEQRKELGFRWKLEFDYDPNAKAPRFVKFLDEVIGHKDTINTIQEYMGYIFLPHRHLNIEKGLWLVGAGSNGKSVFTSILKYVFGEENISYLNLSELKNDEKRGMLRGKILNITQDADTRLDASTYKTIVSGEKLTFRELYKGTSILKSVPKLVIATNDLPRINSGIDAFTRRMILVPFNKVIAEEDRDLDLSKTLRGEIQGIFNFALEGLQRLLKQQKFSSSELIDKAILEYKGDLDILGDFLQDHPIEKLEVRGSVFISQNELFRKLSEWANTNNRKNTYTSTRKLRDKLIADYGYSAYKNDAVYGIKGKWVDKNKELKAANNHKHVNPYANSNKM